MRRFVPFVVATLMTVTAAQADTFLESDDYEEGEGGVVNAFLVAEDYALMEEDLERNDEEFDWGWVKTATWEQPAPVEEPERKGVRKLFGKLRGGSRQKMGNTANLAFDIRAARTIYIPPVQNLAGIMRDGVLEDIDASLAQAAKALGLEQTKTREEANLELGLAVVDQMRDTVDVPVYGIRVQPFVTMEMRLLDVATGERLLLVRNRKHGGSVADAALNFADDLVKFLR